MKMTRCTAAILLMLSFEALVAGRLSAAVADDGVDTIRLPSHGLADELVTAVATENGDDTKRPLKFPPCGECPYPTECSRGHCEVIMTNHGGGDDGQPGADPGLAGPDEATAEAVSTMNVNDDGEEETRPWKCCDLARCTRSMPPTCQCMDKVKKCAKTCKSCEKVEGSSRYVCLDSYRGKQGPACTPVAPPPTFTPRGN